MTAICYVLVDQGKVLTEHRSSGRMKGACLFPTETMEDGEYPDETLYRGLKEELGITSLISYHIGEIKNEHGYNMCVYAVLAWDGLVPDHILDEDFNRLEWKEVHQMKESPYLSQRTIVDLLFKLMLSDHIKKQEVRV